MRFLSIIIIYLTAIAQPLSATNLGQDSNWTQVSSLPKNTSTLSNRINIQKTGLKWNGKVISEKQMRDFLDVIANDFSPQPLLILSYDKNISQADIARVKAIIALELNCNPKNCSELVYKAL